MKVKDLKESIKDLDDEVEINFKSPSGIAWKIWKISEKDKEKNKVSIYMR